jgi:hypothetical protein
MDVVGDAWNTAQTGLNFQDSVARLQGAYLRRRAEYLHKQNSGRNAGSLAAQLTAELTVIRDYIKGKDSLVKGTEPTVPLHLELKSQAAMTIMLDPPDDAPRAAKAWEDDYRLNRKNWMSQIVWRAVTVHSDKLWKSSASPPVLERSALDEILDRRLHAVELMHCNVNSSGLQVGTAERVWKIDGSHNEQWTDGMMVRNFEYPALPPGPFHPFLSQMSNWKEVGGVVLVFTPPSPQSPVFFPADIRSAWLVRVTPGGTLWVTYQPNTSRKFTDVILRMFDFPRAEFHGRNWMFCDMVGCAVNLHALWLGLNRRYGNDELFEATTNKTDYVKLGPVVRFDGVHDLDILMADDKDPFFENVDIDINDLQVGDFVCFWSSRIFDLIRPIIPGPWGNEFSHVMGLDVDGSSGKLLISNKGPLIWLAGHGIHTVIHSTMADRLVDWIGKAFILVRVEFASKLAHDPNATEIKTDFGQTLVLWSPYEQFDKPGAWWLKIPKSIWHDEWDYATTADVLKGVPRTVALESGGVGYNAPPEADAVFFPLFEPPVDSTGADDDDSWRAYLRKRKADPHFRAPSTLSLLSIDRKLAAGLFYRGSHTKIPVVRPRVRI